MKIMTNLLTLFLLLTIYVGVSTTFADTKSPSNGTPSVRIIAPREGERVHGRISVIAEVSDPNAIDYVDFYIQEPGENDRYGWQDHEPPYFWGGDQHMLDTTLFEDGKASVVAFPSPRDSSWHKDNNRVHFTIDNGKPKIKIQSPKINAKILRAGNIVLSMEATDDKGINKTPGIVAVHVYLDGGLFYKFTQAPFEIELSTCLLTPGPHSVQAVAEDSEGFHNADTITINVDPKASCLVVNEKISE